MLLSSGRITIMENNINVQDKIREYMGGRTTAHVSAHTMQCFCGMLETGEATVADFDATGVDLMQISNRYGSSNCWSGTSGAVAGSLHRIVTKQKGGHNANI